jgi:antitoxin (DNA-binding transcriptional repressor) of toxin-antitoxin stability system
MAAHRRVDRKGRTQVPRIAATEAAKNFGRLVDRVREKGATYVIERGGKSVAQIGPVPPTMTVADFVAWLRRPNRTRASGEYLGAVEKAVAKTNRPRVPDDPWER